MNPLLRHVKQYKQHAPAFQRIFGVKLKPFWDNLTGFDIVKFDEEVVQPADGVSTKDAIKERWGDEAVELILQFLWPT